jgi:hypothetical protein
MKKSTAFIFAASILLLAGCCTTHQLTKWEYKNLTVVGTTPDQSQEHPTLNELGKEGWVIVGFTHESGDQNHNTAYYYVFKRKVQ